MWAKGPVGQLGEVGTSDVLEGNLKITRILPILIPVKKLLKLKSML